MEDKFVDKKASKVEVLFCFVSVYVTIFRGAHTVYMCSFPVEFLLGEIYLGEF